MANEGMQCTQVKDLLNKVGDMNDLRGKLASMKLDLDKYPIKSFSKEKIFEGYKLLKAVEDCILKGDNQSNTYNHHLQQYYRLIPHIGNIKNFKDITDICQEAGLLKLMYVGMVLQQAFGQPTFTRERLYEFLQCRISLAPSGTKAYNWASNCLHSSQGHKENYSFSLKLKNVFWLDKNEDFNTSYGNDMLLWHGSKTLSYYAILACSLNKAPPEAPVSGHMFGKGIYFTDCASKAASHCDVKAGKTAYILLSHVVLGTTWKLVEGKYGATNLPGGCHSVEACGQYTPKEYITDTIHDRSVKIPSGGMVPRDDGGHYKLLHNEFVVYNRDQVKLSMLVEVDLLPK